MNHTVLDFPHTWSCENDFLYHFLIIAQSCYSTTSVNPHGRIHPHDVCGLQYTDILSVVQTHGVAPMFIYVARCLLQLQSHASFEDVSKGI